MCVGMCTCTHTLTHTDTHTHTHTTTLMLIVLSPRASSCLWLWMGGWKCLCVGVCFNLWAVVGGKHSMAGVGVCPPQDELCQYCIIWGQ